MNRVVSGEPEPFEGTDRALRPQTLAEFVGQAPIKANLQVFIDAARGRGLARRLYDDLFAAARAAGHARIVCEVNSDPPNPASDAFHAALVFVPVGAAEIHGGKKTVTYLERLL